MTLQFSDIKVGDRVKLTREYADYPMPTFKPGAVGTVDHVSEDEATVWLRLDVYYDDLDEWANCVQVGPAEHGGHGLNDDGTYPLESVETPEDDDAMQAYGLNGFEWAETGGGCTGFSFNVSDFGPHVAPGVEESSAYVLVTNAPVDGVDDEAYTQAPTNATRDVIVGLVADDQIDAVIVSGGASAATKAALDLIRVHARELRRRSIAEELANLNGINSFVHMADDYDERYFKAAERMLASEDPHGPSAEGMTCADCLVRLDKVSRDTTEALTAELIRFAILHDVDVASADEMLLEVSDETYFSAPDAREYLSRFVSRWEVAQAREDAP